MGVFASEGAVPAYPNFGLPRVEEMMFLVLQIGVIVFAAKLGGMVASLFKLPSILGELAAGIAIGPWALGGIGLGDGIFKYGLFNGGALRALNDAAGGAAQAMFGTTAGNHVMFDATSPALYGFATLASVVLLFLSGLETNLKMFLKYSFVGLMVGVGGVVFSFAFGDLCAVYLLPKFFPQTFGHLAEIPLAQAIMDAAPMYMGIMSTATSVGITARILSERKKMDSEEGVSIMAGAVIDDVLGLIVLAIGNGVIAATIAAKANGGTASAGVNWAAIGMVAVKAFGVWLGATLMGVLLARKISWLLKLFKNPQAIAILAFGLSMILAGFFEYMGLAMIIGAYVTGLALSRTDLKHMITETLQPVYTFLVPIFFCVMGMMVDVSALCSKPVLVFGGIYTALAVLAKIVGCALPSFCCGFNLLGSVRIGAGMVPRGEVALIIAGLGLSNGFLSQEIFGIGILMTLVTTVVAPPVLVGLFIPKAAGIRHPKPKTEESRPMTFTLPSNQVAEIMGRKLVEEFRREGFITILLSREVNGCIWEISMDKMELTMAREDNVIHIHCEAAESGVVNQAWMEVVSQMRELARAMSKPMDEKNALENFIGRDRESAKAAPAHVLKNFVMLPKFRADSKTEAIELLIKAVKEAFPKLVGDVEEIKKAVQTREESMPTGLDHGLAVPHGRTDAVSEVVGALAIVDNSSNPNGTIADYETIDHSVVQIIVLTLAPLKEQAPYLQVLANVSKFLRNEDGFEKLLACKTEKEMADLFK
ncbi:MAG: cation:proton antiporter [Kiritimatiellae bacterium]|nr:cation:proton antiporter [Kiritimatiellia bacterium]